MKKMLAIVMVLGLLSIPALAFEPTVWNTEDGEVAEHARVFTAGGSQGACNKPVWTFEMTTTASVAQWINWHVSATTWEWYVRKPGDYYTDCISFNLQSNGDIAITFSGFADLYSEESIKQTIDTYYYATLTDDHPTEWIRAEDLNYESILIPDSQELHEGDQAKLWNRIVVEECNSACEYGNTGTVIITLVNQKDWIDEQGGWDI